MLHINFIVKKPTEFIENIGRGSTCQANLVIYNGQY